MSEVPADQAQRERFITGLGENFSVIASAGSGKTRAITDRILTGATTSGGAPLQWLPALVVVTFTNRAADEMQQRARQKLLEAGVSLEVLGAFNRAFFGTIHSFCVKLLRHHGHHLGLPGKFELLTGEDGALWNEFLQRQGRIGAALPAADRQTLLRLVPVRQLMELGRQGGALAALENEPPDAPPAPGANFHFAALHAYSPKGQARKTIPGIQDRLRDWERAWREETGFLPLPLCSSSTRDFVELWNAAFEPLRDWLRWASLRVAAQIEAGYRAFRLEKGVLTYHDQVSLAGELLRHPQAARRIREKGYRIILDEAQDTDPGQFAMLLEVARPPDAAPGPWLSTKAAPPRPGHFCMVGDFQQSIFGDRADLGFYQRVHESLLQTGAGHALEFSVTFRLDARQIDFLNATFTRILDNTHGQVNFVKLNARPSVLPGQVVRFELEAGPEHAELGDAERARVEAAQLARWIAAQGLQKLRARSWREVAILCPRKAWFAPLREALRAQGLAVQIQSERDLKGDGAAYAWLTALLLVMAAPRHSYEIVGVLREIFGISDHELAAFSEGEGGRFQIATPVHGGDIVARTLRFLHETREQTRELALFSAVREIVKAVQLRERLLSLPAGEFEDAGLELEDLLTLSAAAEARERTLSAFAGDLVRGFGEVREVRPCRLDAIQLITAQKAKGSEWEAVIVPFLARRVLAPPVRYPRLVRQAGSRRSLVALGGAYLDQAARDAVALGWGQEMERLLYVALTRSKHTLVIAHDHALFSDKKGAIPEGAQAGALRTRDGGVNLAIFEAIGALPARCDLTAHHQAFESARKSLEQRVEPLGLCEPGFLERARAQASHFTKRNPSALAHTVISAETDPARLVEPRPLQTGRENAGTRYGLWWHAFVEQLPWKEGPAAWERAFEEARALSPEPARSRTEWQLLRRQLEAPGPLAHWLTRPEVIIHVELPFLCPLSATECVEGIIDLAAFDPVAQSWLILDWKTNRIAAEFADALRIQYEPQLAAYWKAVGQMLGLPVSAALYSTTTGQWLSYEAAALNARWESLQGNPATLTQVLNAPDEDTA